MHNPTSRISRLTRWLSTLGVCVALSSAVATSAWAQDSKPLKPVTIALGTQVINVAYPWLTLPIALGYWKEEGYDVKIVSTSGSLQGIQQLVAGGVTFAQVNSTGLIQSNTENNIPLRGVMGNAVVDWGVSVLNDGPIKSVADLKGKKIGIVSLGTGGLSLLKGYLRANGINPDTDVQVVATGGGGPALEALRADRVQALMFWATANAGFKNAGANLRILRDPAWDQLPDFTLATLQGTLDSNPAMVEAIVRGAAKATLYAETNPECARKVHWKNFPGSKPTGAPEATLIKWDLALLETELEQLAAGFKLHGGKHIGAMDPAAYGRMQEFMLKDGLIKRTVAPESMLHLKPGYIESVNRFNRNEVIEAAKSCKGL